MLKQSVKLLMMLLLTGSTFQLMAQQNGGMNSARMEEMQKKAAELKAKLNLSEPQAAKYDEILTRNREDIRKQIMNLPPDALPSERREIMKKGMDNADLEILEILDSEQQAIYKAEKEKMKQEMAEKKKKKK